MFSDLLKPEIIKSVTGPQSMFVLMVLLLVGVCVLFFIKESANTKISIFLILLVCAVPFALKMMSGEMELPMTNPQPQPSPVVPFPGLKKPKPDTQDGEHSRKHAAKPAEEKTSSGFIRVEADGTTFVITSAKGDENHVPLGKDRVQKVYTAPDGKAGVVVFKIREANQYMAIPVDLVSGQDGDPLEIASMPSSVVFKSTDALLSYPKGGMQKIVLR